MTRSRAAVYRAALAGALLGGAAGAWLDGWLGVAQLAARRGLFLDLSQLPAEASARLSLDLYPVVVRLWTATGVPPPPDWPALFAVSLGAGVLAGACLGVIIRWLDPDGLSLGSLVWSVRRLAGWLGWLVLAGVVAAGVMVLWASTEADLLAVPFLVLPLGAMAVAPFALCREAVVADGASGAWWRGRWPSPSSVLVVVALFAVEAGADAVLQLLASAAPVAAPVAFLAAVLFAALVTGVQAGLLLRGDLRALRTSTSWRCQRVGPWCSFGLVLSSASLLVLGPEFTVNLLLWKVVPVAAATFSSYGLELPFGLRIVVAAANGVVRYWWLLAGGPLVAGCWLAAGRLAWLQGPGLGARPDDSEDLARRLARER